jgi:hypothetical protein
MEVWFYNDTINTEWTMIPTHDVVRYVPGEPYCEVDYNIATRGNTHFGLRCSDPTGVQPVHITAIYFYEPTTASDSGMSEMIVTNTRFYVTLTGNDATGNGSLLAPWRTLKHAMTALQSCWISSAATVTIELGDGYHNHTELVDIGHPCGARIVITGNNCYSTFTSVFNGNLSVDVEPYHSTYHAVFTLLSVANIAVGDYLCLTTTSIQAMAAYMGCFRVEDVNLSTNQVKISIRRATATMPGAQAVVMDVKVIKTVMYFSTEIGILIDKGNTIGAIRNIAIVGNSAVPTTIGAGALSVWNSSTVRIGGAFGVHGFQVDGISCRNVSNIILEENAFLAVNGCQVGIQLTGNCFFGVNFGTVVVNGLLTGIVSAVGSVYHTNKNSKLFVIGNVNYGVIAMLCGGVFLGITSVVPLMIEGNGCVFQAQSGGFIQINYAPNEVGYNGSLYSPLVNTLGNAQGYIYQPS